MVSSQGAWRKRHAARPPDRLLRPLNDFPGTTLDWQRAGHHFNYQEQILPVATLARVSGRIAGLCERLGVVFYDQMDFGGAMAEVFAEEYSAARREAAAAPPVDAPVPAAPVPAADRVLPASVYDSR
jgi:hypothetical protein